MKMLFRVFLQIALVVAAIPRAASDCLNPMDFCFLLDASQSTCAGDSNYKPGGNTCNNWTAVLNFAEDLVNSLGIGPNATNVGLVEFATKGHRVFNLARLQTAQDLVDHIAAQNFTGGYSNISGGLYVMNNLVFQSAYGDRLGFLNVAIIFASGSDTNPSSVGPAIQSIHAANITTYAIGANGAPESLLQLLASPPKQINQNYFVVPSFKNLDDIFDQVKKQICVNWSK